MNSDVCGRCLNPSERRTRQTVSVNTDPYIYVCSCKSVFLGFVKYSGVCVCVCVCVCVRKYLDINIYIYAEQFGLCSQHFRTEVFALLKCFAAPVRRALPTFRNSVSVLIGRLSNLQLTLCSLPEEPRPSLHRGESLKSENSDFCSGHLQVPSIPDISRSRLFRTFPGPNYSGHFQVPTRPTD